MRLHTTGGKRASTVRGLVSTARLAVALCSALSAWGGCLQPAWADPVAAPVEAPAEPASALAPAPDGPEAVPLRLLEPAPFPGVLLGQARFQLYLNQTLVIEELTGLLGVRSRVLEATANQLAETQLRIEEAVEEAQTRSAPGFFSRHGFVIGFCVGIVATGLLVWAAVSVLDAQDPPVVIAQ